MRVPIRGTATLRITESARSGAGGGVVLRDSALSYRFRADDCLLVWMQAHGGL